MVLVQMRRTAHAIGFLSCALLGATGAFAPVQAEEIVQLAGVERGALRLADGRRVVLAGLVIPSALDPSPERERAVQAAAGPLAGQALRLASGDTDRHGRLTGPARLEGTADSDAAVALVRAGIGYADPAARPDRAGDLRAAEETARRSGAGLWAVPGAIVSASGGGAARSGLFTVAEGRVFSARAAGATLYVNFVGPRDAAFTATTGAKSAHGLAPATMAGTFVRVRGVVQGEARTLLAFGSQGLETIAGRAKETER